jgi:hypothetical protein
LRDSSVGAGFAVLAVSRRQAPANDARLKVWRFNEPFGSGAALFRASDNASANCHLLHM